MHRKDRKIFLCALVASLLLTVPAFAANRLANGSFEQWENGRPAGWTWYRKDGCPPEPDNPTPVGSDPDATEAHTGAREGYLRWSDGIGNGKYPERYGQLIFGAQQR